MKYVDGESATRAQQIERRVACLPPIAGVLFVSVAAQPVEGGKCDEFLIRLGIRRDLEENTGHALLRQLFEDDFRSGLKLRSIVFRGISGSGCDLGAATARPSPA